MLKPFLYLRAILLFPFVIVYTIILSVPVIVMFILGVPTKITDFYINKLWARSLLWFSGIRVHVEGAENVPQDKGFLYLFTHSSNFDIPVMFAYTPKVFRYGAKAEILKIPIFGYAVKRAGTLPIARGDRQKVIEVYKQAEKRVAAGEAFALAPEGGRRTGLELSEFKTGPFIFAKNAKMPVVPLIMCGVGRVMKKGSPLINPDKWILDVGIKFLPPMYTDSVDIEDIKTFRDQVREKMVEAHEEMKPRFEP